MDSRIIHEIQYLRTRIMEIYAYVNMDQPETNNKPLGVAFLPDLRIVGDEVLVTNHITNTEVRLQGNIDYAVIQYG